MIEDTGMKQRSFHVRAVWDAESGVYVCESDIVGLHIEAATVDEFEEAMMDVAPELIVANHMSAADIAGTPYKDLIPAIIWERPEAKPKAA
jgi:hypothetical protein